MKKFSDKLFGLISNKVLIAAAVIFVTFVAVANPLASGYMDRLTGDTPSPDTSFFIMPMIFWTWPMNTARKAAGFIY